MEEIIETLKPNIIYIDAADDVLWNRAGIKK